MSDEVDWKEFPTMTQLTVFKETDKAYLVRFQYKGRAFTSAIPKSQVSAPAVIGSTYTIATLIPRFRLFAKARLKEDTEGVPFPPEPPGPIKTLLPSTAHVPPPANDKLAPLLEAIKQALIPLDKFDMVLQLMNSLVNQLEDVKAQLVLVNNNLTMKATTGEEEKF